MKTISISTTLSDEQMQALISALAGMREIMPFLVSLTPADRRTFAGVGDASRAFVEKALDLATHNQDMLPRSFDVEELRKDVELGGQIEEILMLVTQMRDMLADTKLVVNKEAYTAARVVYSSGKLNGKGTAVESALSDMGRRYQRRGTSTGNTNHNTVTENGTKGQAE